MEKLSDFQKKIIKILENVVELGVEVDFDRWYEFKISFKVTSDHTIHWDNIFLLPLEGEKDV